MGKDTHIQGAIYFVDQMDYDVSLNKETLKEIKNGNIIKSKIVYYSDDVRNRVQQDLLINMQSFEEYLEHGREIQIIRTHENVQMRIVDRIINTLIEEKPKLVGYRYDSMGNKINFYIEDNTKYESFNKKYEFDETFRFCEELNKKEPVTGDLFESDYININKPE